MKRSRTLFAVGGAGVLLGVVLLAQTAMPPEVRPESQPMAAIRELEKRIEQRFVYMETAVDKAEAAMEKRLEGMNEFRAQLDNQQNTFVTRDMMDQRGSAVDERLRKLEDAQNRQAGWIAAGGAFLTLLSIGLKVWQPRKGNNVYGDGGLKQRTKPR